MVLMTVIAPCSVRKQSTVWSYTIWRTPNANAPFVFIFLCIQNEQKEAFVNKTKRNKTKSKRKRQHFPIMNWAIEQAAHCLLFNSTKATEREREREIADRGWTPAET